MNNEPAEDVCVTKENGIMLKMRPMTVWLALVAMGGGNALYTHTRPEPVFTERDRDALMRDLAQLRGQLDAADADVIVSRREMAKQVGLLHQACQFMRNDLSELARTGPKAVIERLDEIQRTLGRCTR